MNVRVRRIEPIDPDIGGSEPAPPLVLAAVGLGAAAGAVARYGLTLLWPDHPASSFPWSILAINLVGSAALPFVVVAAVDLWPSRRLLRPTLGTGVLGGFTTLSTFALDQRDLLRADRPLLACFYTLASVVGCVFVAFLGLRAARAAAERIIR